MMTGARTVVPMACLQIADTWMLAGDLVKARYWIEQAQQIATDTGELISELRIGLYLARLLQAEQAADSEVEMVLRQSMQRATRHGARMIALEQAQELSALLARNGQGAEATAILADALNGVPKPHRHASIRSAHELLSQFSGRQPAADQ